METSEANLPKIISEEVIVGEDGLKTTITIRELDGVKTKRTRKIRTVIDKEKVNKNVAMRRQWRLFGVTNKDGQQSGATGLDDEVNLEFRTQEMMVKPQPEKAADSLLSIEIKCRICGEGHWTNDCPNKDKPEFASKAAEEGPVANFARGGFQGAPGGYGQGGHHGRGGYVPPHLRGAQEAGYKAPEDATIRVTNLSENMQEQDFRDMFSRFYPTRTKAVMDRNTGICRGFGFVTFKNRRDGEEAMKAIDGSSYDHMILHCEWSEPRK